MKVRAEQRDEDYNFKYRGLIETVRCEQRL